MKAKLYVIILGMLSAIFAGCGPTMTNLTSQKVPQNASGIYTLSMAVRNADNAISSESFAPKIVVDGTARPMVRSELGKNVFEYDYVMPDGRNAARYYYVLDYARENSKEEISEIYDLQLTNRYVITMESLRGPVGAEIPVVGRGFTQFDKIVMGGFEAETNYQSATSLTFIVPALAANQSYRTELVSGHGVVDLGRFQVDGSKMNVFPNPIELQPGERSTLGFSIQFPASNNGLAINVMTDVPGSVIMPEVMIPAGARSVSIPIEGGNAGAGYLYISAAGFNELQIPISVGGGGSSFSSSSTTELSSPGTWEYPPTGSSIQEGRSAYVQGQSGQVLGNDDFLLEETEIIEITD
ncbi:MAG: cell surface protein [Verrucomicrobiota bacterium]